jgi:hypothetical protein
MQHLLNIIHHALRHGDEGPRLKNIVRGLPFAIPAALLERQCVAVPDK